MTTQISQKLPFIYKYEEVLYQAANGDWFPNKLTNIGPKPHSYLVTNNSGTIFRRRCQMLKPVDYTATPNATVCKDSPQVPSITFPAVNIYRLHITAHLTRRKNEENVTFVYHAISIFVAAANAPFKCHIYTTCTNNLTCIGNLCVT